jgi:hypothetical protein
MLLYINSNDNNYIITILIIYVVIVDNNNDANIIIDKDLDIPIPQLQNFAATVAEAKALHINDISKK